MHRAVLAVASVVAALSSAAAMAATDYVSIRKEVVVDRSVDAVWARVGDYCAIREWMPTTCSYASGNGGVGTVRLLNNGTITEPMVAATAHSYTYWQVVGNLAEAKLHGTLAAEPDGPNRTRLSYTLFYDQGAMPSDSVRASEHARLDQRFLQFLQNMKKMAEAQ